MHLACCLPALAALGYAGLRLHHRMNTVDMPQTDTTLQGGYTSRGTGPGAVSVGRTNVQATAPAHGPGGRVSPPYRIWRTVIIRPLLSARPGGLQ